MPSPSTSAATLTARSARASQPETSERTAATRTAVQPDVIACDLCVIGAGAGGLSVATIAASLGQRVVLVEKHKLGGDSLSYGAMPSKALIASARRAHLLRTADQVGIGSVHPTIDAAALAAHARGVVGAVSADASPERLTGLGIRVVTAAARFVDKATVEAGDVRIKARRFVIATGSSAAVPAIAGLDSVPFLTSATIFDFTRKLDRLIVIGGGTAGLELAQAYQRLGSTVTVVDAETVLAQEDPELAAIAVRHLRATGLEIREGAKAVRVEPAGNGVRVQLDCNGESVAIEGSHVLLATGRRPNIGELGLDAAGIRSKPNGVIVNKGLKTSNRRVFAIGDVTGAAQFTHLALYHAGIVAKRALFRLRAKTDDAVVPRVTFIDPELAWVGLSEAQAIRVHGQIKVLRWPFAENDRARAEGTTVGHVKVIVGTGGRVAGAGVVGPSAGELIQVWALAVAKGLTIGDMAEWIAPYPTLGEINQRVALRSYAASAGRPVVRWLVRLLSRFG